MCAEPVVGHWVICPLCRKADVSGSRYCQRCWGAVLHPEVEITPEEEAEVKLRRRKYLARRKQIKFGSIGLSVLAVFLAIFLSLYFLTDLIHKPDAALNSASTGANWAMFGYDLDHSGTNNTSGVVPAGKLDWTFTTQGPIDSTPAFYNGSIYFGSQDHHLYSLNAATGAVNWQFTAGSFVESSPAVADGKVYFGSNDGNLYALNSASGAKIWSFQTRFPVTSAPSVAGNDLYFGSDDYYIYALNKNNGKKIWDFNTGTPVKSSPVVSGGILFTGSGGNGYAYTLDALKGWGRLQFLSHYTIYAAPTIYGDDVIFVAGNGMIYMVKGNARTWLREHEIVPLWTQMWVMGMPGIPKPPPQSGLLWSYKLPGPSDNTPLLSGHTLYVSSDRTMIAFDLDTQKEIWKFDTGGTIHSAPAIVGNTLLFGSDDGNLYAVDATTGQEKWHFQTGDKISASPTVVNGIVYIGSTDGKMYAIK